MICTFLVDELKKLQRAPCGAKKRHLSIFLNAFGSSCA